MTRPTALPNYVRALGPIAGLKVFLRSLRTKHPGERRIESFYINQYGLRVWLRPTRADHSIFFQCWIKQQYDLRAFPQFAELQRRYVTEVAQGRTPLIIDCGGNIGLSALWFGSHFPNAHIVVVEPDSANLEVLRRNVECLEGRVTVIAGAVWHRTAQLRIVNPEAGAAAFRVDEAPAGAAGDIRAYGIDELCDLAGNRDPLIVKMDVEGAQGAIFSANTAWTARTSLITLELDDWLYPWAGTSRSFFYCLASQPFDYLIQGESIFCFNAKLAGSQHAQASTAASPEKIIYTAHKSPS